MTAIIFGAGGQDGYYLTRLLEEKNVKVIGVSRRNGFLNVDIGNYADVSSLIKNYQPDFIFHLAANSTTRHEAMFENHTTISIGTLNILEAVKNFSPAAKVFISGSGLQFKNDNKPIKESDPFEARDPYCVSRIQSVYAARYFRTLGLHIYVGYFFNHDSPLRTERHMTKKIAEAAKRIAAGSPETLTIGDISVIKEYTYAGDIAKGIWALINNNEILEANVSSGKGYSIEDWLNKCFGYIKKDWQKYVLTNEGFVPEYKMLISDPTIIFSLGWQPEISFDELALIMMK